MILFNLEQFSFANISCFHFFVRFGTNFVCMHFLFDFEQILFLNIFVPFGIYFELDCKPTAITTTKLLSGALTIVRGKKTTFSANSHLGSSSVRFRALSSLVIGGKVVLICGRNGLTIFLRIT